MCTSTKIVHIRIRFGILPIRYLTAVVTRVGLAALAQLQKSVHLGKIFLYPQNRRRWKINLVFPKSILVFLKFKMIEMYYSIPKIGDDRKLVYCPGIRLNTFLSAVVALDRVTLTDHEL